MPDPIDHVISIHQELFTVKFLHDSYTGANGPFISSGLSIQPDSQTKLLFDKHQMGYRFSTDLLICFIRCDLFAAPDTKPKIPHNRFSDDTRIRFIISASTDFIRRTKVDATGVKQVYYFNNRSNAGINKFISQQAGVVNNNDLKSKEQVDPERSCFAILDIYNNGTSPGYDLFNVNGTLIVNEPDAGGINHFPAYQIKFIRN